RIQPVGHRTLRCPGPETRPCIVGAAAKQQVATPAVSLDHHRQPGRAAIRRGPVAVWEVVFARTAGHLDHAVQRDMLEDPELAHDGSKPPYSLVEQGSPRSTRIAEPFPGVGVREQEPCDASY